jgi:hypothetical protein
VGCEVGDVVAPVEKAAFEAVDKADGTLPCDHIF